jgi:hypothetical protein
MDRLVTSGIITLGEMQRLYARSGWERTLRLLLILNTKEEETFMGFLGIMRDFSPYLHGVLCRSMVARGEKYITVYCTGVKLSIFVVLHVVFSLNESLIV